MIYTHTVKSRTLKEMTSPLDFTPDQVVSTELPPSISRTSPSV